MSLSGVASGWNCNILTNRVRCTRGSYGVDPAWKNVVTIEGRVPGTYQPNTVSDFGQIQNDREDPNMSNNTDNYSINVIKKWNSIVPSPELYLHAKYSDDLNVSDDETDLTSADMLVNPFQVDIDVSIA